MLAREEYIKNIINVLQTIQSEINHRNHLGLYDIDVLVEDIFCRLLNLVYGYQLKNANKEVNNAPAADLLDKENRIAVQVTSNPKRDKIQSTIDKFIRQDLYKDYDTLMVLLLVDKPKYTKPFETNEIFKFDVEKNFLTLNNLLAEIKALKIEKLKEINDFLEKELPAKERKSKKSKIIKIIFVSCVLLLCLFIIIKKSTVVTMYYSTIYPSAEEGYYESYSDDIPTETTSVYADRAFSIVSFFNNKGKRDAAVEEQYCEIIDINLVEMPIIRLDGAIFENTLKIFAFNDGWGDANALTITSALVEDFSKQVYLEDISKYVYMNENIGIKSGEAVLLAEYVLDEEKFQILSSTEGHSDFKTEIKVEGKDYNGSWSACLVNKEGTFSLEPLFLILAEDIPVYHSVVLDVDKKPKRLSFIDKEWAFSEEDAFKININVAPTKSCFVKCRNVFQINGEQFQTDIFTALVDVPVFKDYAIDELLCGGELTKELAKLKNPNEWTMKRITSKYFYHP